MPDTSAHQLTLARVGNDHDWVKVAVGGGHTCGIRRDRSLWCWGGQNYGALEPENYPDPPPGAHPKQRTHFTDWIDVATHFYDVSGVRADGSLWCASDMPGDYYARPSEPPIVFDFKREGDRSDWRSIAVGVSNTCATRMDNTLWCWKRKQEGSFESATEPSIVLSSVGWTAVAAATYHTCAIDRDQRAWCFGRNSGGQLGNGQRQQKRTNGPFRLDGLPISVISLAGQCAITFDDTVWCWGDDAHVLGLGTSSDELHAPTRVVSGPLGQPLKQ